ncbi:MAG: hypothetical protein J0H22_16595 [Actinobacteria bacterium]|nr:hypothetical protein [Actinomycetota bacterium]
MADKELEDKARSALLEAIAGRASNESARGLEQLATAFAMTVGAYRGKLPGAVSVTTSSS